MGFFWSVMCNTIVPAAVEDERGGERGDKSAGPVITEASKRGGGGEGIQWPRYRSYQPERTGRD